MLCHGEITAEEYYTMAGFDSKPASEKKGLPRRRHSAQDKQDYSAEMQQEHVRKFAAEHGIAIIKEFPDRDATGLR